MLVDLLEAGCRKKNIGSPPNCFFHNTFQKKKAPRKGPIRKKTKQKKVQPLKRRLETGERK